MIKQEWNTLGDIADMLKEMRAAGGSRSDILYATDRVYHEEAHREAAMRADIEKASGHG